jgi:hypothetical protein
MYNYYYEVIPDSKHHPSQKHIPQFQQQPKPHTSTLTKCLHSLQASSHLPNVRTPHIPNPKPSRTAKPAHGIYHTQEEHCQSRCSHMHKIIHWLSVALASIDRLVRFNHDCVFACLRDPLICIALFCFTLYIVMVVGATRWSEETKEERRKV